MIVSSIDLPTMVAKTSDLQAKGIVRLDVVQLDRLAFGGAGFAIGRQVAAHMNEEAKLAD